MNRVAFDAFMHDLCVGIMQGNRLFGKQIKPQTEWDALNEKQKYVCVLSAIASLPEQDNAQLMAMAHQTIHNPEAMLSMLSPVVDLAPEEE